MRLSDQFLAGSVPAVLDLSGDWVVKGLLGPLPVRFLGHLKQFRPLGNGVFEGNNRFLGRLALGRYRASSGASQLDPTLTVINIDYDQPGNPKLMRGLTDEVRFISDDTLLGRGVYTLPGTQMRPRNIFWFTVTRC